MREADTLRLHIPSSQFKMPSPNVFMKWFGFPFTLVESSYGWERHHS